MDNRRIGLSDSNNLRDGTHGIEIYQGEPNSMNYVKALYGSLIGILVTSILIVVTCLICKERATKKR